jgi:hypothetical protein
MEEEKQIANVTGTTEIIRKMLSHKVSPKKIVETLIPMFTEKGISESLARKRIRPLIYRELKKRAGNKKTK